VRDPEEIPVCGFGGGVGREGEASGDAIGGGGSREGRGGEAAGEGAHPVGRVSSLGAQTASGKTSLASEH